jgi:Amt family ammonium transporter
MRVSAEEEDAGLDISEHGMYGYPEQFIPPRADRLLGGATLRTPPAQVATSTREVPA